MVWCLVICAYFALQAVWRRLLGGGLTLDEAEILVLSRHLAWGYGSQPPLYSWLQWLAFQLIPDRLLAMALLKNLLLAGFYLAVYRLLRSAHPARVAGPAALTLFLLPQVSWESQRDLTHSVLVMTMAALTTLVFWSRALAGHRFGWILFGVLSGLGLLAKPNFASVPLALVLAAASLPELRSRLSARGLATGAVVMLLVVALPAQWALTHPEIAFGSVRKLGLDSGRSLAVTLAGAGALVEALASLLALPLVILGTILALGRRSGRTAVPTPALLDRMLFRTVVIGLLLVTVAVLAGGMPGFRARWLTPAVYLAPPLAALQVLGTTGACGTRALMRTTAVLALLVVVAVGVHARYGRPGDPSLTRAPIDAIVGDLQARYPEASRIVAEPSWLAGNLLYLHPRLPIVSARAPGPAPEPGETVVAVWWKGGEAAKISEALGQAWRATIALAPPERLSAPYPVQPDHRLHVDAARVIR